MTGTDLIQSALRLINVQASGEPLDGVVAADALSVLNNMIDSWAAESLMIFTIQRQVLVPATLKQTYTLGTGGDFNIARPPRIERYGVLNLGNASQPLELPLNAGAGSLTEAEWMAIPVKNISASLPRNVWDDQQFPLRTLSFWPIPNVQVNFTIYSWTAVSSFPDLVTDMTFPPAYLAAMKYNLAKRLAPEFGQQVNPDVTAMAKETKGRVKRMNVRPTYLRCDDALLNPKGGAYNWISDMPAGRR